MQEEDSNNKAKKLVNSKEDDYSSIDPSLVNDLLNSEENNGNHPQVISENDHLDQDNSREQEENEEHIEEDQSEQNESQAEKEQEEKQFTAEVLHVDEDELNQDSKDNQIHSPTKPNKEKYNTYAMERISEVEIEDDKVANFWDKISEEAMKEKYEITDHNFDEVMNKHITSQNVKQLFKPTLHNEDNAGCKFKPEISKASKMLANDRNRSNDNVSNRSKVPVEIELYNDSVKRKEKLEKLGYNHMMSILLNASKTKISNNSHRIAINKIERIVETAVGKYEKDKDKKVSFINVGEILTELKIFREIYPADQSEVKKEKKNYQTYKDIKIELNSIKDSQRRKKVEVDFYEQIWLTLNPDNKEYIKSDIFCEFLKILFSPVASSVKEISSIVKQFLLTAFFLNSNPEDIKQYTSPITEKKLSEEEIWPLDKLVREFLHLKENILAYQGIGNVSKKIIKDIEKERKVNNFHPKINENNKFKSRSNFFEDRLAALFEREKLRIQVLDEMKKEEQMNELKQCTFKPAINKKSDGITREKNEGNVPVYDKLYNLNKEKTRKMQTLIEESKTIQANKELNGCTFKPRFVSQKSFEKSFTSSEKPRGFIETVERLRRGILDNLQKKFLVKQIPVGENYEKVKKANIKPFNITDLNKKKEIKEGEDTDYFAIQIKIPSGKERTLRVYKDDDPYDIADNFCKVYGMKEEIKERLAKTIIHFRNIYLLKTQTDVEEFEMDGNLNLEN